MLKSIDVLIGLALVMLVASMTVTVMTEAWGYIFNTRGRNLQRGIADLLRLLNPGFTQEALDGISAALLLHPLIRDGNKRLGSVIHREELTSLLISLATSDSPQALKDSIKAELVTTLKERGIADPAGTLNAIRDAALRLEKAKPGLSTTARANLAILEAAESRYVAAIHNWFDQTMDRVSHRFTLSTRAVTLCAGLLLACALQLDAIHLINRLWTDDAMREGLVDQAKTAAAADARANSAAGQTSGTPATADMNLYDFVTRAGLVPLPQYPRDSPLLADPRHLTGILFTALLLSLGAPFWYSALQQLLQLRSKAAQIDDAQRKERQSDRAATQTAG